MMKWRGIDDVGLAGAFGDNGTDISIVIKLSISTLYSSCKQHGKYYSSHFRLSGYGMSSSSVTNTFLLPLSPILCGVDVRRYRHVSSSIVHSLPDRPFSLISPLTLANHLVRGLPLFRLLVLTFLSLFFLRSAFLLSSNASTYQFRLLSA